MQFAVAVAPPSIRPNIQDDKVEHGHRRGCACGKMTASRCTNLARGCRAIQHLQHRQSTTTQRATMAARDDNSERGIEAIIQIAEQLAADDVRDGYTHIGPATSGAFRFKWTARLKDDGRFVVEETIGSSAVAVTSRPLPKEEVRAYIDERQRRIQAKVDDVKRELAGIQGFIDEPHEEHDQQRDPLQMYDEIRRLLKESK
jgi:hypothetical protein